LLIDEATTSRRRAGRRAIMVSRIVAVPSALLSV
jgi:hypothetical protein